MQGSLQAPLTDKWDESEPVEVVIDAGWRARLTQEQVEEIARIANAWQQAYYSIQMEVLTDEPDWRIRISTGERIPWGGTLMPRTGQAGPLVVDRRSNGKNLERMNEGVSGDSDREKEKS